MSKNKKIIVLVTAAVLSLALQIGLIIGCNSNPPIPKNDLQNITNECWRGIIEWHKPTKSEEKWTCRAWIDAGNLASKYVYTETESFNELLEKIQQEIERVKD